MTEGLGLSFIVEWENATRIGAERARRMFDVLATELQDLPVAPFGPAEVIVVHSAAQGEPALLGEIAGGFRAAGTLFRALAVDTEDYYQQKNLGARSAEGRLLVFIDSDVIPHGGWLRHLLQPTADPTAALVGGDTVIDCDSLYARMIALIWFFKLPHPELGTTRSEFFWANNFVVRRDVFAAHGFPVTGQYRGQCGELARTLLRHGHQIRRSHRAITAHPPPPVEDLLGRGFRSGEDLFTWLARQQRPAMFWSGTKIVAHDLLTALRRLRTERRIVGLDAVGAAGAGVLACGYIVARAMGFVSASLRRAGR